MLPPRDKCEREFREDKAGKEPKGARSTLNRILIVLPYSGRKENLYTTGKLDPPEMTPCPRSRDKLSISSLRRSHLYVYCVGHYQAETKHMFVGHSNRTADRVLYGAIWS